MITYAFLTLLGSVFLAMKFGNNFVKRLIGLDGALDLMLHIGIIGLFAATGTISGLMTGVMYGCLASAALYFAKKLFPYQKLERVDGVYQWVDYDPHWKNQIDTWLAAQPEDSLLRKAMDAIKQLVDKVKGPEPLQGTPA